MNNFIFHNPTRFIFGHSAEMKAGEACREMGLQRVLIVFGRSSAQKSGLLQRVVDSLNAEGIQTAQLGDIQANPISAPVYQGIEIARSFKADAVMGLGGGSAMDTAKAIALGSPYEGDFWDFYVGKAIPKNALKLIAVPTLAAAGSESSNSSVITNERLPLKRGVRTDLNRPVLALMNPELTFSVPNAQKAYGAADIMAHIFERYFTNTEDVGLTDELCEGVLRQVIRVAPLALKNANDYAAHADLMWAGTLAHNDTLSVGREQDWSTHGLSHGVSARFDAPHGGVLAVLFPRWMEYQLQHDPKRFAQFARRVMGVSGLEDEREAALLGIKKLRDFYNSLGLPDKLSAYGVTQKDIPLLTSEVAYLNAGCIGFFNPLSPEDVDQIYRLSL